MDARVGIVSWQTAELLDRCLAALPAALDGVEAEVVVVDNASTDGSAEVARARGARVIVNSRNVGYARAMNQALAGTEAPFLIAINPDTVALPGSLAILVRRLSDDPSLALVAPRLLHPDGSLQPSVHRFPSIRLALVMGLLPMALRGGPVGAQFWLEGYAPHDRSQAIDWAIGAVHVMRRGALADPEHPYSERTFMYTEDMDLCWRLREESWNVSLEPTAEVVHMGNAAGSQAFGAQVDDIRVAADHEWYVEHHGAVQARMWSMANTLAFGIKSVIATATWGRGDPHTRRLKRFFRRHAENAGLAPASSRAGPTGRRDRH